MLQEEYTRLTEALRLWHEFGNDKDSRFRRRLSDFRELSRVHPEQLTCTAGGT